MSDLVLDKTYDTRHIQHTPPKVKKTEQEIAYNPFFIDLEVEKPTLDPAWAKQPGIILNWLLRELEHNYSLILGVEADTAEHMKAFMDKFAPGHGMSTDQIKHLVMLGHPTLACRIRGNQVQTTVDKTTKKAFYGNLDNYAGILGGELHYGWKGFRGRCWYINYNSGRYGPQHLKKADGKILKNLAKQLFKQYCRTTVYD